MCSRKVFQSVRKLYINMDAFTHANLRAQDEHYKKKTQPTLVKIIELKVASELDSLLLI